MASELCNACDSGRNCINGIYCPERKQYVEHQVILECNERFRNKGEEQNVLPGTPGTDPQSHEGVEEKKPDVEKALSLFKNPQQAAHLAWLLENKKE